MTLNKGQDGETYMVRKTILLLYKTKKGSELNYIKLKHQTSLLYSGGKSNYQICEFFFHFFLAPKVSHLRASSQILFFIKY